MRLPGNQWRPNYCVTKERSDRTNALPFSPVSVSRLEDALSDCIWAQKHMRGNTVIDYRQLGLRFKLHSWQV